METISIETASAIVREGELKSHGARMADTERRLETLVEYARAHSRYFATAYKGIGPVRLQDLPITTKAGLMARFEDWVTDPDITLDGVRAYLAGDTSAPYLNRYQVLTTSGSTGEPMPMVRDGYHNAIHASLIAQRLYRGIDPSVLDFKVSKAAGVIITEGSVSSYTSAMRLKRSLGDKADNLLLISLLSPVEKIVAQLNAFAPAVLTGYPSILAILAGERIKGSLKIAPRVIVSSAEKLSAETFAYIKDAFACPVLNNYCSTEGGEIAMSCRSGKLHLNEDWVLVEPIDDEGNLVARGEWSTGALITDLSGFAQPIIRYRIDDCICLRGETCSCQSTLPVLDIVGRRGDSLTLGGKEVAFPALCWTLSQAADLLQWQLVERAEDTVELRYVERQGTNRDAAFAQAREALSALFARLCLSATHIVRSDAPMIKNPRGGKTPAVLKRKG